MTEASRTIDSFIKDNRVDGVQWSEPIQYDLKREEDKVQVQGLIESGRVTQVFDPLSYYADDLFELRHPDQVHDEQARSEFVNDVLARGAKYGKWFVFPWNQSLNHYPDADEHRELRTFRNRELVTVSEQREHLDATIAVWGLSVGSNIAINLAQSGVGGKFVLGDMDTIGPTNINRMPATHQNIGSHKVDLVGTKISEIDPYIEQRHHRDGFLPDSVDTLSKEGVDVMFDEVDNLVTKAQIRAAARELGVPLLMATDVGYTPVLDIERYDLGDVQPFGGRLSEDEFSRLVAGDVSRQEMQQFTLRIVGQDLIETRMQHSLSQIGETLVSFPQLNTTAQMAASLATSAARQIILGEENLPSRLHVA